MLVRDIVGQLEFMKSNRLCHPLLSRSRTVRVNIHSLGHLGVGLPRYHPTRIMELVAAVVRSDDIHQQDIFSLFIKPIYSDFKRREHSPTKRQQEQDEPSILYIHTHTVTKQKFS